MTDFCNVKWHQSGLKMYADCPQAWRLRYLDEEPQVATEAMHIGTAVHEFIARYARHCYRDGKRPLKRDEAWAKSNLIAYPPAVQAAAEWFSKEVAWDWGATVAGIDSPVEQQLSAVLPEGDIFEGTIDLLLRDVGACDNDPFADSADLYVLVDWKTRYYGDVYDPALAPFQARCYAWLVSQVIPDAREFEARLIAVMPPWMRERWDPKPWRIKYDSLAIVARELQAQINRIKADTRFEANVGASCRTCLMIHSCPAVKGTVFEGTATEDRDDVGLYLEALNALRDATKGLMRNDVEQNGPVKVGDKELTDRVTVKQRPNDVRTLRDVVAEAGHDPWDFVTIGASVYDAAYRKAPDNLRAALDTIAEEQVSTRYGEYKPAKITAKAKARKSANVDADAQSPPMVTADAVETTA